MGLPSQAPMPSLFQGRIVWATIPDPQGRNEKRRRCVVITPTAEIPTRRLVRIVGITTELSASPAEQYVRLPYGPGCLSGLTEESAALRTWVVDIPAITVESIKKLISPKNLKQILDLVESLRAAGHPIPLFTIEK